MTIGPEPIKRIERMSSLAGICQSHQRDELVEQVDGVPGPRRRLGVVLDREGGDVEAAEALECPVVEVLVGGNRGSEARLDLLREEVGRDQSLALRGRPVDEAPQVDCEPVVVGGDLHPAVLETTHWVVASVVAERELEGRRSQRSAEDLVAETDPEDGYLPQNSGQGLG